MGVLISTIFSALFGKKEFRILILGLDNAGKTTILNKLYAPDKIIRTMPTIGFNLETVVYNNIKFQVWDLGGQTNIRPYWRYYFPKTSAVLYVVDSADPDRLEVSQKELLSMLSEEELRRTPICVFANKQDIQGCLSLAQVSDGLNLPSIKDRQWFVQPTSAIKGTGIFEGLQWISETLQQM